MTGFELLEKFSLYLTHSLIWQKNEREREKRIERVKERREKC